MIAKQSLRTGRFPDAGLQHFSHCHNCSKKHFCIITSASKLLHLTLVPTITTQNLGLAPMICLDSAHCLITLHGLRHAPSFNRPHQHNSTHIPHAPPCLTTMSSCLLAHSMHPPLSATSTSIHMHPHLVIHPHMHPYYPPHHAPMTSQVHTLPHSIITHDVPQLTTHAPRFTHSFHTFPSHICPPNLCTPSTPAPTYSFHTFPCLTQSMPATHTHGNTIHACHTHPQ